MRASISRLNPASGEYELRYVHNDGADVLRVLQTYTTAQIDRLFEKDMDILNLRSTPDLTEYLENSKGDLMHDFELPTVIDWMRWANDVEAQPFNYNFDGAGWRWIERSIGRIRGAHETPSPSTRFTVSGVDVVVEARPEADNGTQVVTIDIDDDFTIQFPMHELENIRKALTKISAKKALLKI